LLIVLLHTVNGLSIASEENFQLTKANLFQEQKLTQLDQGAGHNCLTPINRMKAGAANYNDIMLKNVTWTDDSFTPSDMVYWSDYRPASTSQSLISTYNSINSWKRLFKQYPLSTLYGSNGIDMADVSQGRSLGNCYFIAAIVALAENPDRLNKLFVI